MTGARRARWPYPMIVAVGLAVIAACGHVPESIKESPMTSLSTRLQPLFAQTKTVCFGRFIVDVPVTATVVYGPAWAPSDIVRYEGEADKLDQRLREKLAKIAADRDKWSTRSVSQSSLYGTVVDGSVAGQKIVFGHSQGVVHELTSFLAIGADLYVQRTTASPDSDALSVESNYTVAQRLSTLNTVARHLRARADNDIPKDSGLCIDGAFIADNPAVTHERVTVGVRLKEFPDVHLSIEVNKNQGRPIESSELEPRIQRAEKEALAEEGPFNWRTRIVEFRRGPRQLGAWRGFEYLIRLPAEDHQQSKHDFDYMAIGSPSDPYVPMLEVTMKSGIEGNTSGKVKPSVTDEEAVALWDQLIESIRVRPTSASAGTKTSQAESPKFPLGELAATGRNCPQSGWWESVDEGRMPERRQYFEEGVCMPRVLVLLEPNAWQRLRGQQPTHRAPTMWKLVSYEPPPAPG